MIRAPSIPRARILRRSAVLSRSIGRGRGRAISGTRAGIIRRSVGRPMGIAFPIVCFDFGHVAVRPDRISGLGDVLRVLGRGPRVGIAIAN